MVTTQMTTITAIAPAKLILSGEHAVVHGCPALATAIDFHTTATVTTHALPKILFEMANLGYKADKTQHALHSLKQHLQEKYNRFRQGEISINAVLHQPFELLEYTTSQVLEKCQNMQNKHFQLDIHSDIPIGCGMGSSAASIVSVSYALSQLSDTIISPDTLYALNIDAENLQHGRSSGVDIYISTHGGCHLFYHNQPKRLKAWQKQLMLINTGKPESTTGECVQHSKAVFAANTSLAATFTAITEQMSQAWQAQNQLALQAAIRANHRLLVKIGVVPTAVQQFIAEIEQCGGAAKICGAGAVRGDNAGIIWVEGNLPQDTLVHHLTDTDILHTAQQPTGVHLVNI